MTTGEYRNIEISDPALERDHLRLLTFRSPALHARGDVTIFVPPESQALRSVPLVLLLHGVYGSHWVWSLKGGAHQTAHSLIRNQTIGPLVIAMPSDGLWGDGSGYVVHAHADYERWIMEDVIGCVTEVTPCLDLRSPLFLAGFSMGGYGALRLGAKHAHRVNGFSGLSSITHPSQMARFVNGPLSEYRNSLDGTETEIFYWMAKNKYSLPPFRFDCGLSDTLIEENRELHRKLIAEGIAHEYFEYEGGHTWDYWRERLVETLLFFAKVRRSQRRKTWRELC